MVSDFFEYGKEKNKKTKKAEGRQKSKATCAEGARFAYEKTCCRQEGTRSQAQRKSRESAAQESGLRFRLDEKRGGRQAAK